MKTIPKPSGRDYTKKERDLIKEYKHFTDLKNKKAKAKKDAISELRQIRKRINKSGLLSTRPLTKEELAKRAKIEKLDMESHAAHMAAEQRYDMLLESVGKRRLSW